MLKRIFTCLTLLCVVVMAVKAQEVKKPRMYVERFTTANGVGDADSDKVRQTVMAALNKTKRFELVDQDAESSMKQEETPYG